MPFSHNIFQDEKLTLQKNISLTTNLSNKKLLIIIVINLDIKFSNKKLLVTKLVTIINKKLKLVSKLVSKF